MGKNIKNGLMNKIFNLSENILTYIAMMFLIIMVFIVSVTVCTRYIFNFTFRWSDEIALLMMIWFGFIGIALGVKSSIHLSIEFFMSLLPDKYQNVIYGIENILVGIFGWFMLTNGLTLYNSTKATKLPATMWSRGLLYIMIPISGAFVLIYSIGKLFNFIEKKTEVSTTVDNIGIKGGKIK